MWTSLDPVKLIRYLLVWRVNSSLVQLPVHFSVELSRALGAMVTGRLPTRQAAPWRKAMGKWGEAAETGIVSLNEEEQVEEAQQLDEEDAE